MRTGGRRSAAAAIADVMPLPIQRPNPPPGLTTEEAIEWRAIVNRMPAGWFLRETLILLEQYCHHSIAAREIAFAIQELRASGQGKSEGCYKLVGMQAEQTKMLVSLATKMRLTQQSTYEKRTKKPVQIRTPWKSDDDGGLD
jgi:hypothetical protein